MKISVVIPILNSHEIFRRQCKYFQQMSLPDVIEFIFVDDGSNPPLTTTLTNASVLYTNNKRPWTQGLARNLGASKAKGEYIFFTDIDHIISRESLEDTLNFSGNKMMFPRYYGILDKNGNLSQDIEEMEEYGFDRKRMYRSGKRLYASYHGNTYAIKKETFYQLGGYPEKNCLFGFHAPRRQGEDCAFNKIWNKWAFKNGIQPAIGAPIYMFPVGRWNKTGSNNPLGLFHTLSYEQIPQPNKE